MNVPPITNKKLLKLASTYWQWRMLWIGTTLAFAGMGLIYVLFLKGDMWVASQGLIVRDEASGAVMRLGRFQSQTEMKAAQETILEMARNAQVLNDALTVVGRPRGWFRWAASDKPPTTSEIDALARHGIEVRAPRGAELGTTEVIYLDVKQNSPQRAVQLVQAVCDALENRLQHVRQARADGVIAELVSAKETVQRKLEQATEQLKLMEAEAGADLSDLRGLTDSYAGGSANRQVLDGIKSELRQAELQVQQLENDLRLATDSYENPDRLLLAPSSLVNSQTALKALRDGLAAATITTSQLQGRYTLQHPLVQASLQSEVKIREQLRRELGVAVQSLQKDCDIASGRVAKLKARQVQLQERLENLAHVRADYANVAGEVRARSQQLQEAERELGMAQASREAALTSSLITRLDRPLLGEKPLGPGRSTILAGATLSGLIFGWGIVFLLTPLDSSVNYGRRRQDYAPSRGRRAADVAAGQSGSTEQAGERRAAQPLAAAALPATTSDTTSAAASAATTTAIAAATAAATTAAVLLQRALPPWLTSHQLVKRCQSLLPLAAPPRRSGTHGPEAVHSPSSPAARPQTEATAPALARRQTPGDNSLPPAGDGPQPLPATASAPVAGASASSSQEAPAADEPPATSARGAEEPATAAAESPRAESPLGESPQAENRPTESPARQPPLAAHEARAIILAALQSGTPGTFADSPAPTGKTS